MFPIRSLPIVGCCVALALASPARLCAEEPRVGVVVTTSIGGQESTNAATEVLVPIGLEAFVRAVPLEWNAPAADRARYQLKIDATAQGDLGSCAYQGGHKTTFKQVALDLTIVDLQLGDTKAKSRLAASDQWGCGDVAGFGPNTLTQVVYRMPNLLTYTEWLLANLRASDLPPPPVLVVPSRKIDGRYLTFAFDHDGRFLLDQGGASHRTQLHDGNGEPLRSFSGRLLGIGDAPGESGGRRVFTADADGVVNAWAADSGNLLFVLKGHAGPTYSVAVSHDRRFIATVSQDDTVRVWNAVTGKEQRKFSLRDVGEVLAFGPSDQTLLVSRSKVSTMARSTVEIDATTGKELRDFQATEAIYRPDGKEVAAFSGRTVSFYPGHVSGMRDSSLPSGKLPRARLAQFGFDLSGAGPIAYLEDGTQMMIVADDGLHVVDTATGREVARLLYQSVVPTHHANEISISADGRFAATSSLDEVLVWDLVSLRSAAR